MRLTKKQKKFLLDLLSKSYMPGACSHPIEMYLEGEDKKGAWKEFKEDYGITITTALKWWSKFILELEKDTKKNGRAK